MDQKMVRKTMDIWMVQYEQCNDDYDTVIVGIYKTHTNKREAFKQALELNRYSTNRIYSVLYKRIPKERYSSYMIDKGAANND